MIDQDEHEERLKRLRELAGAIELVLGHEWFYVVAIGKPGDRDSANMLTNAREEDFQTLIDEVLRRWDEGRRPEKVDLAEPKMKHENKIPPQAQTGFNLPDSGSPS